MLLTLFHMDEETSNEVTETDSLSLMVAEAGEVELVPNPDAESQVWQYFGLKAENGKLIDNGQVYCKISLKLVDMKWKHFKFGDAFEE